MIRRRPRRIGLALVGALVLCACSSETGLIIAVTGESVDELEFQVGVKTGQSYVLDQTASGQRRQVTGRNLRVSPYELLLREEDESGDPATVQVLARGYRQGKLASNGVSEPQVFIRGEVLRRDITLASVGSSPTVTTSGKTCYRVRYRSSGKDVTLLLLAREDRDCDGYSPTGQPADCDDQDAAVHPGATEVCDGKDDNCDGKVLPSSQLCYALEGSNCRQGARACHDAEGGSGLAPACAVASTDQPRPSFYCEAYAGCSGNNPLPCAQQKIDAMLSPPRYGCKLEALQDKSCAATLNLKRPFDAEECLWTVKDAGGFNAGFDDGAGNLGGTTTTCEPVLGVALREPPAAGIVKLEFKDTKSSTAVSIELKIDPRTVDSCGAQPLVCVKI